MTNTHNFNLDTNDITNSESNDTTMTKTKKKSEALITLLEILVPITLILLVFTFVIGNYMIPSSSMVPVLDIQDRVFTTKINHEYHRGDIVVFSDPGTGKNAWLDSSKTGQSLIKNIVGLPGDTVKNDMKGNILVNGEPINKQIHAKGINTYLFNIKVPNGYVFVVGSNLENSADSRYHYKVNKGLVPIKCIQGVAKIRYWHNNRFDWTVLN